MTDLRLTELSRGAFWSAAGTASVQVLALIGSLVSARALGPEVFGVVGMASVVALLAATLTDPSLAPAIVSDRLSDPGALRAAHWLACAAGAVGCGLTLALAPAAAWFFGEPRLTLTLAVLAPSLLFTAAGMVPQAILQQTGRFRALAIIRAANQAATTAGIVALAALHAGLWTLVIPVLVAAALTGALSWAVARPRAPAPRWTSAAGFLREGARITGHNACNFLARNADNVVVGRLAGSEALGLYGFAYTLLLRPLELFSHSLIPVLIRSFGRSRGDARQLSDAMVLATGAVLRLGAPVMIGGALTCDLFVPLLFGPHWGAAVPLVRILMVAGAIQLVGPVFGSMLLAVGASRFLLRWGVWTALASTCAFLAGAILGKALGVALAYLAYTVAAIGTMYLVARRLFHLPLAGLGLAIASLTRDLALMVVAVAVTGAALRAAGAPPAARLLAEILLGALAYAAGFRVFAPGDAARLVQALPEPLGRWCTVLVRLEPPR